MKLSSSNRYRAIKVGCAESVSAASIEEAIKKIRRSNRVPIRSLLGSIAAALMILYPSAAENMAVKPGEKVLKPPRFSGREASLPKPPSFLDDSSVRKKPIPKPDFYSQIPDEFDRKSLKESNIIIAEYLASLAEVRAMRDQAKKLLFELAAGFEQVGCWLVVTSGKEDRAHSSLHEDGWAIDVIPSTNGRVNFTNERGALKELIKYLEFLEETVDEVRVFFEYESGGWNPWKGLTDASSFAWTTGPHIHIEIKKGAPRDKFFFRLAKANREWIAKDRKAKEALAENE